MIALTLAGSVAQLAGWFTVVTAAMLVVVGAWAASKQGLLRTVTEDNTALRAGRQDDKERLSEARLAHETDEREKAELRGQVTLLKQINSGIVNWNAVTDQVSHHNERAEKRWITEDRQWTDRQTVEDQRWAAQMELLREILAALTGRTAPSKQPPDASSPDGRRR